MTLSLRLLNAIMHNQRSPLLPSQRKICLSKTTSTIDLCTTPDTSVQHASKGVQVDPGSALSIILKRLLYFLGIPLYRLSATTTTIYGFNAGRSHPLEKIRLRCRIGSLKLEVTCYVIDADTSYNLLWNGHGSMPTGSFPLLCTNASNMLKMTLQHI